MFAKIKKGNLQYLKFKPWEKFGLSAIFTGKMSEEDQATAKLYKKLGIDTSPIIQPRQVHGKNIFLVKRANFYRQRTPIAADASLALPSLMINKNEDVEIDSSSKLNSSLVLQGVYADCTPIYLCEPEQKILALIHAGWRGTARRICQAVIRELKFRTKVNPEGLQAIIGPAIARKNYQVGPKVLDSFKDYWQDPEDFFAADNSAAEEKYLLDLKKANYQDLLQQGLKADKIFVSSYDTFSEEDLFYSYRREGNQVKRMKALLFWHRD